MYRSYYLKPCDEKLRKKKLFGFDIETYGKYNKFLMGSIVNEKDRFVFWDKESMQNFIFGSNKIRSSLIFATNLSFDFLALFGNDIDMMKKFTYIIKGSDFINIKLNKNNHNFSFRDTYNFASFSVEKLGQILNIQKLPKPKYLGKKVSQESIKGKKLEQYNIRDSYISFKFAEFLQDSFNSLGGNLKYTIATTSMNIFRRCYLKEWIQQPKKNFIKLMFKSYYGGRTEAFYRGLILNKYYYDINSLYPYVMKKYHYPFPNTMQYEELPDLNLIKRYEGISLCNINAPKLMYPLLPYRTIEKLIFPTGKFTNWQSHAELRKALELGYEIEPIKSIYYEKNFSPFKEFVDTMYKLRLKYKAQNNSMELPVKIVMNSLYGKFAQRLDLMKIIFIQNEEDRKEVTKLLYYNAELQEQNKEPRFKIETPITKLKKINGKYYDNSPIYYITDTDSTKYPKFINPIISLYVTSYARLELYKWIEKCISDGGKVYYCDTDSIMTDIRLPQSKDLGKMKLEYKIKKGIIIKPKFYFIASDNKDIVRAKGMHGLNTYTDFENVLRTKNYTYMKFSKFKESLRRGLKFNEKLEVVKTVDLEDNKRIWKNKEIKIKELEKSKAIKL